MKQARKWLAVLLTLALVLGALPMAALAAEDGAAEDGAAEAENLDEFKAALEDDAVRRIVITGNVVIPEGEPLDAGEKEIHVSLAGNLLLDPGAVMTSDTPMGKFSFEEEDGVSQFDRIAFGMAAFLMDENDHRVLLGSLPEDVGAAIDGMTTAVLSGDVTLEGQVDVGALFIMNGGVLTIAKGSELKVHNHIHAELVNDFGDLWIDEDAYDDIGDYNRPRLMACWNEEHADYGRSIFMTPYDEYEIEKFVLYDYRDGVWDYFDVDQSALVFDSPLFYGEVEGHEDRPTLTAKGAEWGETYEIGYEDYTTLWVYIVMPDLGCFSSPDASTENILTGSLQCSPLSGEFYVCVDPGAWFLKEGWTVSDLAVRCVRYGEQGEEVLPDSLVACAKVRDGVWKITVDGCDFSAEFTAVVTSPDGEESFDIGTGLFMEPAQPLAYSDAPLDGEDNGWGIPWKESYKSVLHSTLSLKTGASKDVALYLLVYQSEAEDGKPAGWYCESVNIGQIRAEGVTVAQGKEDDDHVIRITAGSAGTHKVIRMQEEQVGDDWVLIPGSTRGVPLTVSVTASSSSGGSGSSSGGSSSSGTVVGNSGGRGSGSAVYSVSVPSRVTGGTVSARPQTAKKGDTVTVTVTPEDGYALNDLTVTAADGKAVPVTETGNGRYTFTMPASKVSVSAAFQKAEAAPEPAPEKSEKFTDVAPGAYYYDAVQWAVEKGVTGGTGAGLFSPDAPCTRAQIVTFLWRAAGSPAPSGKECSFTDVASGAYYRDAVLWAVEQGITSGATAETFRPEAIVTRGQTAAFLHRAAGSPAAGGASFTDVPSGAYYAGAVQWAAEKGITSGTGEGLFNPGAPCTRAQIVTFLYRSQEG